MSSLKIWISALDFRLDATAHFIYDVELSTHSEQRASESEKSVATTNGVDSIGHGGTASRRTAINWSNSTDHH